MRIYDQAAGRLRTVRGPFAKMAAGPDAGSTVAQTNIQMNIAERWLSPRAGNRSSEHSITAFDGTLPRLTELRMILFGVSLKIQITAMTTNTFGRNVSLGLAWSRSSRQSAIKAL
jgi:hypothetical protein